MKIFFYTIAFLSLICHANCQPSWLETTPVNDHASPFKYYVGSGNSYNEAIDEAIVIIASQGGVSVSVARERLKEIGADLQRKIENKELVRIDFGEKSFEVQLVEQAKWKNRFHVLYAQKTKNAAPGQSPGRLKDIVFVRRSLVVPSWGQYYNQESVKASLIAAGELTLTGVALFSFSQAGNNQNNAQLALATGNLVTYNNFIKNRNQWRTVGRISIVTAIALWIINVVDAASSEKNRYVFNDETGKFSLYASNQSFGIQFRL